MPYSPRYNVTYLPAGADSGQLYWSVAQRKLVALDHWEGTRLVAQGKVKRANVHIRHRGQYPPGGDVGQSMNPDVVDVYLQR